MTTPGGACTPCQSVPATPPCSHIGFYHGVGAPTSGPSLYPAPMPSLALTPAVLAHNTRRYGHPLPADLVLSGRGYADFHADANFAVWGFSEVRFKRVLRSSPMASIGPR